MMRALAMIALVACGRATDPPDPRPELAKPRSAPAAAPADAAPDPWAGPTAADPRARRRGDLEHREVVDATGNKAPLSRELRDVSVLVFWASWCHPCMEELPRIEKLAAALRGPRVAVIGVSLDPVEDRDEALGAIRRLHLTFPIVQDPDAGLYTAIYGDLVEIPAIAIVSRDAIDVDNADDDTTAALIARYRKLVNDRLH